MVTQLSLFVFFLFGIVAAQHSDLTNEPGKAFLARVKTLPGVFTLPSGLMYKVYMIDFALY